MNARDLVAMTDKKVIRAAIMSLAFGALPLEDWGPTLAAAEDDGPGETEELRNIAFTIWFPTATDFLLTAATRELLRAQTQARGLGCEEIFALADELAEHFHAVLALLTREEQIFIRDRRWQSIYGNLDYFISPTPTIRWYDSTLRKVETCHVTNEELQDEILAPFYVDQTRSETRLRGRVMKSRQWGALIRLHKDQLTTRHLLAYMKEYDVR